MRGFRKRRVGDLSVVGPAFKKFKTNKSNPDLISTKANDSIRSNGFLRKLEVVLDRSIVNNYLDSKNFLRSRLELNCSEVSHEVCIQKNKSYDNNLDQTASLDYVKNHESCIKIPEEHESLLVKMEPVEDTNDKLYFNESSFGDCVLIKQELSDEMVDVENSSDSETDVLALNNTTCTEQQPTDISINSEDQLLSTMESVKVESSDATLVSNYCENEDISIDEEIKSEDLALSNRMSNNEKELETHFENQENQSNALLITAKEPLTSGTQYYYCDNCNYQTTSKICIYRHIRDNYITNKDGFVPCEKCNKRFKTENILKFHKTICGTKWYFTCKFCPKISSSRYALKRHIITQHPEDFEIKKLDKIMQQIVMARERKDVNQMAEVLKNIPVRNRKIKTIFDRKKLIKMYCSTCNVISDRGRITKATECSKCGKMLRFQCQICEKTYPLIGGLRAHIKWSCKNAETKLTGDTTILSNFERESNVIVFTKFYDEQSYNEEFHPNNYDCKICKIKGKKKNSKVCKHIKYRHAGCRYENGFAVCPKCNGKFKMLQRFLEHNIFCGVQIHYACPFCPYTSKNSEDIKRHIVNVHDGKYDIGKLKDILSKVKNERTKVKDKYIADHMLGNVPNNIRSSNSVRSDSALNLFCSNCCTVHDIKKKNRLVKFCPKCEKIMEYQCRRCGKLFANFKTANFHDESFCKATRNNQS